jgi:GAF domain-containing protein
MGLEQGSSVSLEPQPGIEQKKIERAKQNIKASQSVSAFSSEKEEEYEKSIRSVYQLQQWHFEQEELKKQNIANALDSQIKAPRKIRTSAAATNKAHSPVRAWLRPDHQDRRFVALPFKGLGEQIKGLEERISTLNNCQRPLFEYDSLLKDEMLDHAMKVIQEALNTQISAVFLIDKKGMLKRYSLYGITSLSQSISPNWFPNEEYTISTNSFVGKTALASHTHKHHSNTSRFGELHYSGTTDTIDQDMDNEEDNLDKYKESCGEIHQIVTLPINNHFRTVGVLRIINKIDPSSRKVLKNSTFSDSDVIYLSLFASEIGAALLNFERDSNRRLFASLMKETCRPEPTDDADKPLSQVERTRKFVDIALNKIVKNESSPFNFAIIRFLCDDKNKRISRVASIAAYNNELNEGRVNDPIKIDKHNSFVSYVVTSKQHIVISDISNKIDRFHNNPWIANQKFSTFCCFPLQCRKEGVFGTLSLYTAYRYTYDAKSTELLQSFCDALSAFLYLEKLDTKSKEERISTKESEKNEKLGKISLDEQLELAWKLFFKSS